MIVAAVILIFPTKSAQGFLWLTAADRWYPPLQTAADPAYALATVLMVTLAVYVVAGIFYFTVPKVAAPMRPRDHISWVDEYSDLKSRFTPLIANAGNLTEAEAGERIANRLAPPPARRQLIFARGTERHEALRAALYIYKSAHLAVWDFNDASHHLERAIRSELWKLLLATGRDANQSASELVIVLRPPCSPGEEHSIRAQQVPGTAWLPPHRRPPRSGSRKALGLARHSLAPQLHGG